MDTVTGIGIKPKLECGIIKSDGTTILGGMMWRYRMHIRGSKGFKRAKYRAWRYSYCFTVAEEVGLLGAKILILKLWMSNTVCYGPEGNWVCGNIRPYSKYI